MPTKAELKIISLLEDLIAGGGGGSGGTGDASATNQLLAIAQLTAIANSSNLTAINTGTASGTSSPNIAVNDLYYTAIRDFTGAATGDTILVRETINTAIPSTTLSAYRNLETGLVLGSTPVIGTDISFTNSQPVTSSTSDATIYGSLDAANKIVSIATGGRPTLRIATIGILNASTPPVIYVAKSTASGTVWTPYTNFDSSAVMTGGSQLLQIDVGAFDFVRIEAPAGSYTGTLVISLTAMPHPSSAANNQLVHSQSISKVSAQTVNVTASSTASSAVSNTTERIVLTSTVNAWIELGATPTALLASGTSFFLPAGVPSYPLKVVRGVTKVAVIAESAAGKLSILESS